MTKIFDGKKFAQKKREQLSKKVAELKKNGITPKLETIVDEATPAGMLYTKIKQKAASEIGVVVDIYPIARQKRDKQTIIAGLIRSINLDPSVHGIMVQLPLSTTVKRYTRSILSVLDPKKDVDGHLENSSYLPATVSAVLEILELARHEVKLPKNNSDIKVVVLGSKGVVGKSLTKKLYEMDFDIKGIDKTDKKRKVTFYDADVVISATGKENLVTEDKVKDGVVVIDVGSPKGDVDFRKVSKKASFITPVPGGVGPVTIACLLENLVKAAEANGEK